MKIKVSEATPLQLDYVVGSLHGYSMNPATRSSAWIAYSTNWAQGGPIIEREKIELIPPRDEDDYDWMAVGFALGCAELGIQEGPTPLIAAMRCYVASKLGDEVDVPEELT